MRVALTGGAYTAHSVIASAQRSLNLYSEPMPQNQGEPMPAAHYPTPGLRLLGAIGSGPIRGIHQATQGHLFVVSGDSLYLVDPTSWTGSVLGSLTPGLRTPVSMADNGLDLVVVDGSANGWQVTLANTLFAQIDDPNGMFVGATRVDYLDTFFILNKPNTPQFYISGSLAVTFDPLDFANKESYSDLLEVAMVAKRLLYLYGRRTTEIWYDAGATFSLTDPTAATSFQFAPMQSEVFIDHGIVAPFSAAVYDNLVFWLTRDRQGQGIVMMVSGYDTKRVSTYAIEAEIAGYGLIHDAIGFCYQLAGHTFYVLTFPNADRTWCYDITTQLWHEWAWIDANGDEHRHRANCFSPVTNLLVVGDWQNGNLYALDNTVFDDNGSPIKRLRSFPHLLADGKRVFYRQFLADMETGNAPRISVEGPTGPSYSTALTQINANISGLSRANTSWGFPANTDFHTLLMSFWMCGPVATLPGLTGACGIWPAFNSAAFFLFRPGANSLTLSNQTIGSGGQFYEGTFNLPPPPGMLVHCMLSVDTHAQVVQVYINDQAIAVTGGTWTGTPPFDFNVASSTNIWAWDVSNVIGSAQQPALADAWISNTPTFVDLSVVANRRKFINRDLSPCDLGATGTTPFGYQPALYMSVRPGGAPADILINRGLGGGAWGFSGSLPPTVQTGVCSLATPPPRLSVPLWQNLISLRWSDDRGHSWGSPVAQSIGDIGEYRTSLQWQRLGMTRDRCFEISWSVPMATALQGCWLTAESADSAGAPPQGGQSQGS
jgi:hypothetical protein